MKCCGKLIGMLFAGSILISCDPGNGSLTTGIGEDKVFAEAVTAEEFLTSSLAYLYPSVQFSNFRESNLDIEETNFRLLTISGEVIEEELRFVQVYESEQGIQTPDDRVTFYQLYSLIAHNDEESGYGEPIKGTIFGVFLMYESVGQSTDYSNDRLGVSINLNMPTGRWRTMLPADSEVVISFDHIDVRSQDTQLFKVDAFGSNEVIDRGSLSYRVTSELDAN